MLSSSLDTLLKMSKTTYPKKLFAYDCVTLYIIIIYDCSMSLENKMADSVKGSLYTIINPFTHNLYISLCISNNISLIYYPYE